MSFANADVVSVLEQLSLPEKIKLLGGEDGASSFGFPEYGIPSVKFSDGPSGFKGKYNFNGAPGHCFPCGVGLAASFDVELLQEVAVEMSREAKAKKIHVLLGPTVNIARSPLCGRGFEFMGGEDPFLAGTLASAFVETVQKNGISACVKHFVGNEQETEKHLRNSMMSPRALREIHLEPFRIITRSVSPASFMTAYNKINNVFCCENSTLLQDILRGEWGWKGAVISDWYGTHSVEHAIKAGLDLEMPGPTVWRTLPMVLSHIEAGILSLDEINRPVKNMLALAQTVTRNGLYDDEEEGLVDDPAIRKVLRKAAAASVVLLKNDNHVLPLGRKGVPIKSIAVIGPNADVAHTSGGGAAAVPLQVFSSTPLQGITEYAAGLGIDVEYAPGILTHRYLPQIARYLKHPEPRAGLSPRYCAKMEFWISQPTDQWQESIPLDAIKPNPDHVLDAATAICLMTDNLPSEIVKSGRYVRYTADFVPSHGGDWEFGLMSVDHAKLFVNGELVIDYSSDLEPGTFWFSFCHKEKKAIVSGLKAGTAYRLELRCWSTGKLDLIPVVIPATFQIGAVLAAVDESEAMQEAVQKAATSDVTIVLVGLSADYETEGADQRDMNLPGRTDELIEAVLKVQPEAIVIVQSGMPVAMPWEPKTKTLVQAYYGGSDLGSGLADVLFGAVNPSAKVAVSIPKRLEEHPSFLGFGKSPYKDQAVYQEEIYVGYRYYDFNPSQCRFPFGHGLSYTTFELSNLSVTNPVGDDAEFHVSLEVTNTGDTAGAEVVQIYIHDPVSNAPRPHKELKAFRKLHLSPGEKMSTLFDLDKRALGYWEEAGQGNWVAEDGEFTVLIGTSSAIIALEATVVLDRQHSWRGL